MNKKAVLIVLDGAGIGALPDAGQYGDDGAHTVAHVLSGRPALGNLWEMGLANIKGSGLKNPVKVPVARFGRMLEKSPGKDTTTGHWEICGTPRKHPFPLFPESYELSVTRPARLPAALESELPGRHVTAHGEPQARQVGDR